MGCSTYSIAVSSRKSSDFADETHLAAALIALPIFQAREGGAEAPTSLFLFHRLQKIPMASHRFQ